MSAELPFNQLNKKLFDRRDRLQRAGIEFLDPKSPHDVLIHVDIPYFMLDMTYGQVCVAIGDVIKYRLALSHYRNAGCLPLHDKVRIKLIYQLNDLQTPEDMHTARVVHERILDLLQERVRIPVPFRLYVVNHKWEDWLDALVIQQWAQEP